MNKRFTNKKPYSQTGMAKRLSINNAKREWLRAIINSMKKGKI